MGWYVNIQQKNNPNNVILERKYSLGFPILMFKDYTRENGRLLFEANGKDAKDGLTEIIRYLKSKKNSENEQHLDAIIKELYSIRGRLEDDVDYISDYSEAMFIVDNPNFEPVFFIQEMFDKLEDAISGYSCIRRYECCDQALIEYINGISEEIRAYRVSLSNEQFYAVNVAVMLNSDDEKVIEMHSISADSEYCRNAYLERKLFYILNEAGLKFDLLPKGNNVFYVLLATENFVK